jgi:hypothetical protein
MASQLERVLDSINDLNKRINRFQRREERARADSEERARKVRYNDEYQDRISRQARFAEFQAKIDSLLEPYGVRAPAPSANQSARNYKIQLLQMLQDQLPPYLDKEIDVGNGRMARVGQLARFPLARVDDSVIDIMSPQIQAAAKAMAFDKAAAPEGEMVMRKRRAMNGADVTEFHGERSFVKDLGRENRRARINDPTALAMVARGFVKL